MMSAIGRIRKIFRNAEIEYDVIHTMHKVGYQFTFDISAQENTSELPSIAVRINVIKYST